MSKSYCTAVALAALIAMLMLASCSHTVIEQPTCYVHADLARITAECQAQINQLASKQLRDLQNLERNKRSGDLMQVALLIVLLLACAFAFVHLRKVYRQTTIETHVGLIAEKQHQYHEWRILQIEAAKQAAVAASHRPQAIQMPHTLTIHHRDSHDVSYTDSRRIISKERQIKPPALPSPNLGNINPNIPKPSLVELMNDTRLIVGIDMQGNKLTAEPSQLFSLFFGGDSGTGKTSAMLWLAIQLLVKYNARLAPFDPQKGMVSGETFSHRVQPLTPYFFDEPYGLNDTEKGLKKIKEVIDRRMQGNARIYKLLILADEFNTLIESEYGEQFKELGRTTNERTRKAEVMGWYAIHRAHKSQLGGMGHTVNNHFVCATKPQLAKLQMNLASIRDVPQDIEQLQHGFAYWKSLGNSPQKIWFPFIAPHSIDLIMKQHSKETQQNHGEMLGNVMQKPDAKIIDVIPKHPRHNDIVELIKEGWSNTAIIKNIFDNAGGNSFTKHMETVKNIRANM